MELWESVGSDFDLDALLRARELGWQVLAEVASQVRPGHYESDVRALLDRACAARGLGKPWHPAQIRLGRSTRCAFAKPPLDHLPLAASDIFFLDIGPLAFGHEADCGQTFVLGDDAEMQRCAEDAAILHRLGREHWLRRACTGRQLYEHTRELAEDRGWQLALLEADGHRLGDFPHHRFYRGNLADCDFTPASDRWVYEIQLLDPSGRFGAFFEDLLTNRP